MILLQYVHVIFKNIFTPNDLKGPKALTTMNVSTALVNEVIILNVDNITSEWKTYILNFTVPTPGPMVSSSF
jgi:hypothetical protein